MLFYPCETESQEKLIASAIGESVNADARVRMDRGANRCQNIVALVVIDVQPRECSVSERLKELAGSSNQRVLVAGAIPLFCSFERDAGQMQSCEFNNVFFQPAENQLGLLLRLGGRIRGLLITL